MSATKGRRKIETRTLLYILLVVVIIGGVYIFITNQPPEIEKYSPSDVIDDKIDLIESGETIIVRGYYYADVKDGGLVDVFRDIGSEVPASGLKLDATGVDNVTIKLSEGVRLDFTGHLEYIDPDKPFSDVIFIATEITK